MSDLVAIRTLVSQGNPLTADEGAYLLAEADALREQVEQFKQRYAKAVKLGSSVVDDNTTLREELEQTRNDVRMHAAANQRWRAENERLREALERIARLDEGWSDPDGLSSHETFMLAVRWAQRVLAGEPLDEEPNALEKGYEEDEMGG